MKTYNMHVTSNSGEFNLSFTASDNEVNQSHWAFSSVCSNLISGFGITKPLEDYHRIDLASYLEELRQDELGNEDSPFYNNGVEWTPNRVSDL